jgi:hypothetical protein
LFVSNAFYKSPNPTMKHNQDWSTVDLEALAPDAIPVTSYKPVGSRKRYDAAYTAWQVKDTDGVVATTSARDFFRLAWRMMAANTGERTLISVIIPPGTAHINGIHSTASPQDVRELISSAAVTSSLLADFAIRAAPKAVILQPAVSRLPQMRKQEIRSLANYRVLRLNCTTVAYETLWRDGYEDRMSSDSWAGGMVHARRAPFGLSHRTWTSETPLRIAADRRQALVEIDALVALELGLTADELCTIYRTQFPVLFGYDRKAYLYDVNGRLVPKELLSVWRRKGDSMDEEERTAINPSGNTYTYELPFQFLDREADMREAYAEFERRLGISGGTPTETH